LSAAAVGVFDSGSGGLTILSALAARCPDQTFIYLGDHARAPYGERAPEEIYRLTEAHVERLFLLGCRLVLLACNTAAAVALRRLQQDWLPRAYPDNRVLGVLAPMVEAVTRTPWQVKAATAPDAARHRLVGVLATPATVASGAYRREIQLRAPEIDVIEQACPGLADLIEAGAAQPTVNAAAAGWVGALMQSAPRAPDAVILGCTHYPLIEDAFRRALPASTELLGQPAAVAEAFADYIARRPEYAAPGARPIRYLTTADPAMARRGALAARLAPHAFERIETACRAD